MATGAQSLTSSGVQPTTTSFALEVFGLLMVDEDFEVVKIALAVVAPWSL